MLIVWFIFVGNDLVIYCYLVIVFMCFGLVVVLICCWLLVLDYYIVCGFLLEFWCLLVACGLLGC